MLSPYENQHSKEEPCIFANTTTIILDNRAECKESKNETSEKSHLGEALFIFPIYGLTQTQLNAFSRYYALENSLGSLDQLFLPDGHPKSLDVKMPSEKAFLLKLQMDSISSTRKI